MRKALQSIRPDDKLPAKYEKGEQVIQNGEVFYLDERTDKTFPTKNKWALVQWKVTFKNQYGMPVSDNIFLRPILEVGTPNENFPEPIEISSYTIADDSNGSDELEESLKEAGTSLDAKGFKKATEKLQKTVTKKSKKHRGRPPVPMNELKAKNAIRDFKQGNREDTDPLVVEAFDFLVEAGQDAYLEKHFFQKV